MLKKKARTGWYMQQVTGLRSAHLSWGFRIGRSLCIHSGIRAETQSSLRKVSRHVRVHFIKGYIDINWSYWTSTRNSGKHLTEILRMKSSNILGGSRHTSPLLQIISNIWVKSGRGVQAVYWLRHSFLLLSMKSFLNLGDMSNSGSNILAFSLYMILSFMSSILIHCWHYILFPRFHFHFLLWI